jgi:hypothetical protein
MLPFHGLIKGQGMSVGSRFPLTWRYILARSVGSGNVGICVEQSATLSVTDILTVLARANNSNYLLKMAAVATCVWSKCPNRLILHAIQNAGPTVFRAPSVKENTQEIRARAVHEEFCSRRWQICCSIIPIVLTPPLCHHTTVPVQHIFVFPEWFDGLVWQHVRTKTQNWK